MIAHQVPPTLCLPPGVAERLHLGDRGRMVRCDRLTHPSVSAAAGQILRSELAGVVGLRTNVTILRGPEPIAATARATPRVVPTNVPGRYRGARFRRQKRPQPARHPHGRSLVRGPSAVKACGDTVWKRLMCGTSRWFDRACRLGRNLVSAMSTFCPRRPTVDDALSGVGHASPCRID